MFAFILRRIGQAILVLLTVALISFSLFRFVGDPTQQMVSQDTTLEERLQIRKNLGLDDPVIVQFGRFVGKALRFDFGLSYQTRQPVATLIGDRFPATIELAFASALFALFAGIPMGVYAGLKPQSLNVSDALVSARFNDVSFSALTDWLQRAQRESRLVVSEASVSARERVDRVDAQVSLKRLP